MHDRWGKTVKEIAVELCLGAKTVSTYRARVLEKMMPDVVVLDIRLRDGSGEEGLMKKILVIDDEAMIIDVIKVILEDMGYSVTGFQNSREGEKEAIENDYDLIVVDIRMPEKNGAEVTESILKAKPESKILIITAYPTDPLAKQALDAGALSLLKKPFEVGKIIDFLKG